LADIFVLCDEELFVCGLETFDAFVAIGQKKEFLVVRERLRSNWINSTRSYEI